MRLATKSRIRLVGTALLAAVMAATVVQVPAQAAGPDPGLCSYTEARGKIPGNFPISACFDGQYLVVVNTMSFPITVNVTGGGTPVWSRMNGASGASHFLALKYSNRLDLLPPKYKAKIRVGSAASQVKLGRAPDNIHKVYTFAEFFWSYVPLGPGELPRSAFELINELIKVGDEYDVCVKRTSSYWYKLGCEALLVRNIGFAFGRAALNVATGGLAKFAQAFMNLITSQKWALSSISGNKALNVSGEFTISAAPQPPPDTGGSGGGGGPGGGDTGGGSSGGGGSDPPPPPTTRVVTIQNKHVELSDRLVEDSTSAYLSTVPQPRCRANGCMVPGTDMWSGYQLTVRCWGNGAWMTNENLSDSRDDNNPYKWSSTLWYMGVWPDGREGWISEIYIVAENRGGMGLPSC